MSSFLETLSQAIGPAQVKSLAQQIGASPEQTEQAIGLALPTLLGALAKQTDDEQGAQRLHKAIEQDHDGSVLDNLGSLLGMGNAGAGSASSSAGLASSSENGLGGLLGSILGGRQSRVEQGIGQASGLSGMQVASLLAMLAPLVMGLLGRHQRQQNGGATDLTDLLRKERTQIQNQAGGGLLAGLLDQDGDGDFDLQDMLKFGMKKILGR
ncbi:MAG: DUF937 domain-containing protein [Pirellulaceae bacterium]|nr:DUF937 domain-containing protein [Pirellulaceae bacterium]